MLAGMPGCTTSIQAKLSLLVLRIFTFIVEVLSTLYMLASVDYHK